MWKILVLVFFSAHTCPPLRPPRYGFINVTTYSPAGSPLVAVATCQSGYHFSKGVNSLTVYCTGDRVWSNNIAECQGQIYISIVLTQISIGGSRRSPRFYLLCLINKDFMSYKQREILIHANINLMLSSWHCIAVNVLMLFCQHFCLSQSMESKQHIDRCFLLSMDI